MKEIGKVVAVFPIDDGYLAKVAELRERYLGPQILLDVQEALRNEQITRVDLICLLADHLELELRDELTKRGHRNFEILAFTLHDKCSAEVSFADCKYSAVADEFFEIDELANELELHHEGNKEEAAFEAEEAQGVL